MIRIQDRDLELIDTLKVLRVMSSSQIQRLFFGNSQQAQSRRCKQLVNHKYIKVFNPGVWEQNVYYTKRRPTQQLKSMLLVSELYVILKQNNISIQEFKREYCVPNTDIRADAYFTFERDNYVYEMLVEVDLTHWDGWKYEKYLKKNYIFPPLLSISPYKRKYHDNLECYHVKQNFSNIDEIMKLLL